MTRENKLALVVGFGLILFIGILISDHFSVARSQASANLTNQQIADPLVARTRDEADLIALQPDPPPVNPPLLQGADPAVNPSQMAASPAQQRALEAMTPEQRSMIDRDATLAQHIPSAPPRSPRNTVPRDVEPVATLAPQSGSAELTAITSQHEQPISIPGFEPVNDDGTPITVKDLRFHDVRGGESMFAICKEYYGDINLVNALARFNKMDDPGALRAGRRLMIPPPETLGGKPKSPPAKASPPASSALRATAVAANATKAPAAANPKKPPAKTYTVKDGDSLSTIAQRLLGDREKWRDLARINRRVIDDPDNIKTGTVLRLG